MTWQRYVALGDSQTEGLNDLDEHGNHRGWADRFAERLALHHPGLHYANLAVRACRARHVHEVQLPAALAMRPDLATVVVGMNDMLRHDYDLDQTVHQVEETFAALVEAGAHVLTMSFPDIGRMLPVMRWLVPRQRLLNERLREAAGRHGVAMLELFDLELNAHPGMWSHDRIHGSAEGHGRIAEGMAELVGLPGSDASWRVPPDPERVRGPLDGVGVVARDARWVGSFLVPFLVRQWWLRGRDAARLPKRPELLPVLPVQVEPGLS